MSTVRHDEALVEALKSAVDLLLSLRILSLGSEIPRERPKTANIARYALALCSIVFDNRDREGTNTLDAKPLQSPQSSEGTPC